MYLEPLELLQPDWREEGIRNKRKARALIKEYRFSSLLDLSLERPQREILAEGIQDLIGESDLVDKYTKWASGIPGTKVRAL